MNLLDAITTQARKADDIVAYQAAQPRTWDHWLGNFNALCTRLESEPHGYWGLYYKDSYDFSIALFALLATQRVPLLAPDTSPMTLASMASRVDGMLGELPDGLIWQPSEDARRHAGFPTPSLDPSTPWRLALSTSGSSGDAIIIDKTQRQIESEVEMQADLWREDFDGALIAATVSHQHIYGLLIKVLLPFVLQRPFVAELLPNPRSFLQAVQRHQRAVWLASPAQLKRVNLQMLTGLDRKPVHFIVSSGGLLAKKDATQIQQLFGKPAVEIYGSTETGGIAYRRQYEADASNPWQPLPQVEVRISDDGVLQVQSPFAGEHRATTGDRASLHDDGLFTLSGRADTIVKLEEKRISLTSVERQLEQLPQVTQARALVLPGNREILAACVVLSPAGDQQLNAEGRTSITKTLRTQLADRLEKTALPKRFRFLDEMPMNAQGKTRIADLAAHFEHSERNVLPVVKSIERNEEAVVLVLWVPEDLDYFAGHFPEFAVLPGVAMLLWVRHFAKLHLAFSGGVRQMTQVKFKSMVRPGDELTLTLRLDPATEKLRYRFVRGDTVSASGIMSSKAADG
jgi:3-hydroxymyristoyl/3-hydroxydecanoyl-(acyl carrier protein) dehydratase